MVDEIFIVCDGNWSNPEVQVSGTAQSLIGLGEKLKSIEDKSSFYPANSKDQFYPVSIPILVVEVNELLNDRLSVNLSDKLLSLTGSKNAIDKLGDSLLNFFELDSGIGDHFQLDYYEGNEILNETKCMFFFVCDRR